MSKFLIKILFNFYRVTDNLWENLHYLINPRYFAETKGTYFRAIKESSKSLK